MRAELPKERLLSAISQFLKWLMLFVLPVFLLSTKLTKENFVIVRAIPLLFFILVFYLNYFVLVPKVFFGRNIFLYFFYVALLVASSIVALQLIQHRFEPDDRRPPQHRPPSKRPPQHKPPQHRPPQHRPPGKRPPQHRFNKRPPPPRKKDIFKDLEETSFFDNNGRKPPPPRKNQKIIPPRQETIIKQLISLILIVCLSLIIRVTSKLYEEEQAKKELEKEHLQFELAHLKNQISPHFFFNTLNNIYMLVELNPEDAQHAILKLSKMMRYLLYESETETTLKDEISFLESYIDLMKLRVTEKVRIRIQFPEKIANIKIPPLLFITLVENAFKHGISYRENSFIDISLKQKKDELQFKIENSKRTQTTQLEEKGGIGIKNIKKRLELLYPGRYQLKINDQDSVFSVELKIKTYET